MSHYHSPNQNSHDHEDIPRFEPWLGVMAGSLLPALLALALPQAFSIPLIACTVLLFAAGSFMLARQGRRRSDVHDGAVPSRRPQDSPTTPTEMAAEAE